MHACMEPEPEPPGASFFCLEPTQFGRSRSQLRDLGLPEPEPPKKWRLRNTGYKLPEGQTLGVTGV